LIANKLGAANREWKGVGARQPLLHCHLFYFFLAAFTGFFAFVFLTILNIKMYFISLSYGRFIIPDELTTFYAFLIDVLPYKPK
jgi:hypothetical protein